MEVSAEMLNAQTNETCLPEYYALDKSGNEHGRSDQEPLRWAKDPGLSEAL
jgi:hypothetical protein